MEGRVIQTPPRITLESGAIAVVSAENARDWGMAFYKASNGVILTPGKHGFVPGAFVFFVRELPTYKVLRSAMSKRRGSTSAPVLGLGYGDKGGNKRQRKSLDIQRGVGGESSSSGIERSKPKNITNADDSDLEDMYQVETTNRRKRGKRADMLRRNVPVTPICNDGASVFSESEDEQILAKEEEMETPDTGNSEREWRIKSENQHPHTAITRNAEDREPIETEIVAHDWRIESEDRQQ